MHRGHPFWSEQVSLQRLAGYGLLAGDDQHLSQSAPKLLPACSVARAGVVIDVMAGSCESRVRQKVEKCVVQGCMGS